LCEALPWVARHYAAEVDWEWLVRQAKLHDFQNRLGFLLELAGTPTGPMAQARSELEKGAPARRGGVLLGFHPGDHPAVDAPEPLAEGIAGAVVFISVGSGCAVARRRGPLLHRRLRQISTPPKVSLVCGTCWDRQLSRQLCVPIDSCFPFWSRLKPWALEAHDLALTKLERSIDRDLQDVMFWIDTCWQAE
jgi:hypothetical protein